LRGWDIRVTLGLDASARIGSDILVTLLFILFSITKGEQFKIAKKVQIKNTQKSAQEIFLIEGINSVQMRFVLAKRHVNIYFFLYNPTK